MRSAARVNPAKNLNVIALGSLEKRYRPDAAVGADADDGAAAAGHRRQFLHRLAHDARAGRAERMADGDAAAVRVHALGGEGAEVDVETNTVAQVSAVLE